MADPGRALKVKTSLLGSCAGSVGGDARSSSPDTRDLAWVTCYHPFPVAGLSWFFGDDHLRQENVADLVPVRNDFQSRSRVLLDLIESRRRGIRGAGEGNRTLVSSLGSWRSTIELHPRENSRLSIFVCRFASGKVIARK